MRPVWAATKGHESRSPLAGGFFGILHNNYNLGESQASGTLLSQTLFLFCPGWFAPILNTRRYRDLWPPTTSSSGGDLGAL